MFERSFHFVPASRPRLFERVDSLGADAYVFDLEDAVAAEDKPEAITALKDFLSTTHSHEKLFVRVNGTDQPWWEAERELLAGAPQAGIVLPKVESAAAFAKAIEDYKIADTRRVIALVESAPGLAVCRELAGVFPLFALGLGLEDFLSGHLFSAHELPSLVERIRCELSLAAMAAGIIAIDTISTDTTGGQEMRDAAIAARAAGMHAKFSIHPTQIGLINDIFSPPAESIEEAEHLVKLAEKTGAASGYLKHDGKIISPPKLKKAQLLNRFAHHYDNAD